MGKVKSREYYINKFKEKHGDKFDYSQASIITSNNKIKIICSIHGEFEQFTYNHLGNNGCRKCSFENNILSQDVFICQANKKHNFIYDYSKTKYIKSHDEIIIICKSHGEFKQKAFYHLQSKGCPKCLKNVYSNRKRTIRITKDMFIDKANKIHKNKFDYNNINYISFSKKIELSCPDHGKFITTPAFHCSTKFGGCRICYKNTLSYGVEGFLKRAKVVHGDNFDYKDVNYINFKTKIKIFCKKCCKIFEQTPHNHLNGLKCNFCSGKNRKLIEDFIKESNIIHKLKYSYSNAVYVNSKTKIKIDCSIHGEFLQTPTDHLFGAGCPKCSHNISNQEIEWLDFLNVPKNFRNKRIRLENNLFKPDAIDIENKIIWEFYGDFWHGNPNRFEPLKINKATKTTFEYLYNKTLNKELIYKRNGFRVIFIWESDWLKNKSYI